MLQSNITTVKTAEIIICIVKQPLKSNILQKEILNYLLKLSKSSLSDEERNQVDLLFNTVNDIERIGDHAENLAELAQSSIANDVTFSDKNKQKDVVKIQHLFTLSISS